MSNRITQHQAAYVLDRDQTYQTNAQLALHCQRQGTIGKVELSNVLDWLGKAALRRHRQAQARQHGTGLVHVQDSWRNGGHHD